MKRKPEDPTHSARRMSLNEQRPAPGVIGQMWNSYVRPTTLRRLEHYGQILEDENITHTDRL